MDNFEYEKQVIKDLESYTLYADFYIKDSNKGKFDKERFSFMYGAACGVRALAVHLKIDVSFYDKYFDRFKKIAENHDILCRVEPPED